MELKDFPIAVGYATSPGSENPFNGIERCQSARTMFKLALLNPFNGIESYQNSYPKPNHTVSPNPFNGIER